MLKIQQTFGEFEVPPLFRDPNIHTEYRPSYKPWKYYVASFFQLHNQSINIWSHFAAMWIFLYKIMEYSLVMDYMHDPLAWAFLVFAFGSVSYTGLSTFAHMFHSKSEHLHFLTFQMAYIGVGLSILGTNMSFYFFMANEKFYQDWGGNYLLLSVFLSISTSCCLSYAKLAYSKPYPFEKKLISIGSLAVCVTISYVPLYYLLYECITSGNWSHFFNIVYPHLKYTLSFLVSSFFYASHLPEIVLPGKFDLIGQGHQFFHLFMSYCSFLQFKTILKEYRRRQKVIAHLADAKFGNTLMLLIIVIAVDLFVLLVVTKSYRNRRAVEESSKFKKIS